MRRFDHEIIIAVTELNIEHFKVFVVNSTVKDTPTDYGFFRHSETRYIVVSQRAGVIGRAVAIKEGQGIHLRLFGYTDIRINRCVEVAETSLRNDIPILINGDYGNRRDCS